MGGWLDGWSSLMNEWMNGRTDGRKNERTINERMTTPHPCMIMSSVLVKLSLSVFLLLSVQLLVWPFLVRCLVLSVYVLRFMTLGSKINSKFTNTSGLLTEQVSIEHALKNSNHSHSIPLIPLPQNLVVTHKSWRPEKSCRRFVGRKKRHYHEHPFIHGNFIGFNLVNLTPWIFNVMMWLFSLLFAIYKF